MTTNKTFVCLGNTGREYKNTKHNVGKMFGDFVVKELKGKNEKLKAKGRIVELENGWQVVFLDCLMNNSGLCLQKLLKSRKLKIENLIIVHDDLDIPFGKFKIQKNRGAAGHKGVQSIISVLGTKDFGRVRIGIGRPPENIPAEDYVLMHFTREERKELKEAFDRIVNSLLNATIVGIGRESGDLGWD